MCLCKALPSFSVFFFKIKPANATGIIIHLLSLCGYQAASLTFQMVYHLLTIFNLWINFI